MPSLMWLAILAGAYIALGAIMFTIITNDLAAFIGDGLTRLIGGISFSIGLIPVSYTHLDVYKRQGLLS